MKVQIKKENISEADLKSIRQQYTLVTEDVKSIVVELKISDLDTAKELYNAMVEINE